MEKIIGWKCKRCGAMVDKSKAKPCNCETSPSPWEPMFDHSTVSEAEFCLAEIRAMMPTEFEGTELPYCVFKFKTANKELSDALEAMLNHYLRLAESGDAGNWNPEEEDVVKRVRKVLAEHDFRY